MQNEIVPAALRRFGDVPLRIDWYGDIVQRLNYGVTTPYVQLSCTRYPGQWRGSQTPEAPVLTGLPVALLRAVRLGDIWQRGRRVGGIPLARVSFERVVIDDESATIGPAGLPTLGPDNISRYELPFAQFAGHRDHTLSCLVKVDLGNGCVLLVPSMEIVRFYFGACGSLLANMFGGALAGENLYSYARKDKSTGVANLTLDATLPGVAAATVARIAFDKAAARQFRGIVNTGIKAAANRQKWYPRVGFPLAGMTTITADGVWLERQTDRAFVVHRLVSCSHPFPFTKLYYRSEFSATKLGRPPGIVRAQLGAPDASLKVHIGEAVGTARGLAPVAVPSQEAEDPFPDLLAKQIHKVKDDFRSGFARSKKATAGEEGFKLGIGGHSDGGVRQGDVLGASPTEAEPFVPPIPMQELLRCTVKWGDKSILSFRAPFGGGRVARVDVRLDDGRDVAYWVSRLVFLNVDVLALAILVIVAEPGAARDQTEMLLYDVTLLGEITARMCDEFASVFWADDATRERIEAEGLLIRGLSSEQLNQEGGGLALTIAFDWLACKYETLPVNERQDPH
ncbi:hypothetical protein LNV09_03285 [Paucibacter sp. B2R-40]|uniref:hypothetical protein n=1 Tax=Paucibacter sp. B2R-40 TaxID=2893554 RepID=UPI0021E3A990|nr:hypothetical protein [Paucibacter sp. B2R-40]MCV2353179.1 hypothetical protein [Paucibacter sp. B2R-40]